MKIKLPPALANHLSSQTNGAMTIENVTQVFKTAFPGFQSMESNFQKSNISLGDHLSGIKFPDMGIMFGSHNSYTIFGDRSDIPNLILPVTGCTELKEDDGSRVINSALISSVLRSV